MARRATLVPLPPLVDKVACGGARVSRAKLRTALHDSNTCGRLGTVTIDQRPTARGRVLSRGLVVRTPYASQRERKWRPRWADVLGELNQTEVSKLKAYVQNNLAGCAANTQTKRLPTSLSEIVCKCKGNR